MKLYKYGPLAILEYQGIFYRSDIRSGNWDQIINRINLRQFLLEQTECWPKTLPPSRLGFEPPIGKQEVWASGVTYLRSKVARMEESEDAGGGDFYDKVYDAERPELFFKATAARTVGSNDRVHIRKDSTWNVPEPELTLLISSLGTVEGYTIGNDMSSRSIEGANPLYLPQAKTYERCAGLGPCIYLPEGPLPTETAISLEIIRDSRILFQDNISIAMMKRTPDELVGFLFRECNFPQGCFLMTGTGLVPPDDFTLQVKDEIRISIDQIGTLVNFVDIKRN